MSAHVEAYRRHKNLKLAAAECGMPWQSLYVALKKAGEPVTGDKSRYGSRKDKLTAKAEQEFQSIVPFAENMNKMKWQAKYDFDVLGLKVEVKAATLKISSAKSAVRRWAFSFKKQTLICDFMCCFCYSDAGTVQRVIIAPSEIFSGVQAISVSENVCGKWAEYEIPVEDVAEFFRQLA